MKSRFNAFLIHLVLSAIVALIAIFVVFFIWYPAPLPHAFGVSHIFFLLLAVDVVMGPIMTFIVYQPKKKSLTFDLSVIALLQIAALGYGLNTIFQGRPAFVVFNQSRFEAVRTIDINAESQEKALVSGNALAHASWLGPQWVAARQSLDLNRANEIMFSSVSGGADWPQLPELYVPLIEKKARMLKKAKSLQALKVLYKGTGFEIKNKLKNYDDNNQVKWLPLHGLTKNMIVLIDANSAEVVNVIDINPYP